MTDTTLNLAQIGQIAGVGRAAVVNWRRRNPDFPEQVGGTEISPLFARAAAEQWLHDRDLMPLPPGQAPPPATVTFDNGTVLTVHGAQLHSPAHPWRGGEGYEEFTGYIEHDRPGVPWPTVSVRIDFPDGRAPYAVASADVDISGFGGHMDFLRLMWPVDRGAALPSAESQNGD
ncbi:hypothetical protein ABZ419_27215 [Streptomyces cinnamoneus]|uniref:hypothetical protein n=1 Tax=Streptomyces cinnamoneus TaxID=53446 RepID=UPI0033DC0172